MGDRGADGVCRDHHAHGRGAVHQEYLLAYGDDDPATAKKLLDADRIYYTETEVAQVALPHRSGELFRAVSRLGEASAYCGTEPGSNMSLVVFGVTDVAKAVSLLRGGRQKQ